MPHQGSYLGLRYRYGRSGPDSCLSSPLWIVSLPGRQNAEVETEPCALCIGEKVRSLTQPEGSSIIPLATEALCTGSCDGLPHLGWTRGNVLTLFRSITLATKKTSREIPLAGARSVAVPNARETEIARRLALIIDRLPISALHSFLQNLSNGVDAAIDADRAGQIMQEQSIDGRQWQTASVEGELQFPDPVAVGVEVLPLKKEQQERFDLVLPVPTIFIGETLTTSIVFEFKLGPHNPDQLKEYSRLSPNSTVISVETGTVSKTVIQGELGRPIVLQNWEHLYYALQSMLSGDAQPRVVAVDEPDDLLLKFDHRVAGQDRLAFEIESFLQLIIDRGLLPNRDLVLVIPRGSAAAGTLGNTPPYYCHPESWTSGYRYLVVIYRNVVENIYRVIESVTTDPVGGQLPSAPAGLETMWPTIASVSGLRVSMLAAAPEWERYIGKRYISHGPNGGHRAFTMGHRYVEHPSLLADYFNIDA
jgi:hypothetical protein